MMSKISACIISYNEEKKIADCLESLEGIVDEIVLVDSNSTDKTIEIASSYTDKIYRQDFLGYVDQKNLAVEKASHDWILSLDCDERLSSELRQSIEGVKDRIDAYDAYTMNRKTYYVYRWLNHCWYPDRKVRLFNKRQAKWVGLNLHEKVGVGTGNTHWLAGDILHYSFDTLSDHLQTLDRFTEIGAEEILQRGERVSIVSPLAHGAWTFFSLYFLRRGLLDGFAGLMVSVLSFTHVFVKYSKVIVRRRRHDN